MKSEHLATDSPIFCSTVIKTKLKTSVLKFKEKTDLLMKFFFNNVINNEISQVEDHQEEQLLDAVNKARYEWYIAKANFQHVSDSDLVDQAIYAIAAAEKKYLYLLKMAGKDNLKSDLNNLDINRMRFKANEFNI